jgi:hypothetical protein
VTADPIRAIADAVLYEGYILWPYRRSATKNQRRFQFGGVYPPGHSSDHPDDRALIQTEVLLEAGPEATVTVSVRFLQVVHRAVARRHGPALERVDELVVGEDRYLAWDEAVEREVTLPALSVAELQEGYRAPIAIPADTKPHELRDATGAPAGALIRSWHALHGEVRARALRLDRSLWRIRARIVNLTDFPHGGTREDAVNRAFCSTHTLLRTSGGAFVSQADPPEHLAGAAADGQNLGTWPVPVGEPGDRTTMLSSPIILEDFPRVAPESPGDLFDGGEIDQLLTLNILALTDAEKAEMAATDPRAREILQRTQSLTPEQLMALHGTMRDPRSVR